MSVADKDGRIAQMLADRLACLSMEIHEALRETTSGNPYGPGGAWKFLECCQQQSIDGHLSSCPKRDA